MFVRMRTVAALVRTWALAELVRMRPKDKRCGGADANGEDKMSLSSFFFLKKLCMTIRGAGLRPGPQPS
jgi:hypothetical protein